MKTLRISATRSAAAILLSATTILAGCTAVDVPRSVANPNDNKKEAGYDAAMDYLLASRSTMLAKARHREAFDATTKAGLGIGLAGAALKAGTKNNADPMAGFLTLGGISYAANRGVNPQDLSNIYRTGAFTLECLRTNAVEAYGPTADARLEFGMEEGKTPETNLLYQGLATAIITLQADVKEAKRLDLDESGNLLKGDALANALNEKAQNQVLISQAQDALKGAWPLKSALYRTLSGMPLGEHILSRVNATNHAVDLDAQNHSPDIEAIREAASSGVAAVFKTGTDIQATKSQAAAAFRNGVGAQTSNSPLQVRLIQHMADLRHAIDLIPDITVTTDYSALDACEYIPLKALPVTVKPNPVPLAAGKSVTLEVTGSGTFSIDWPDAPPSDIAIDNAKGLTLTADKAAKARTLHFKVKSAGVESEDVTLNVTAGAAAAAVDTTATAKDSTDTAKTTTKAATVDGDGTKKATSPQDSNGTNPDPSNPIVDGGPGTTPPPGQ